MVRAAAICLVIGSHAANNVSFWFGLQPPSEIFFAGDLGVDLFFALSGFLIGRILLRLVEEGCGWGGFGRFLARRALRTLPAYYAWMVVLFLFGPPQACPVWYLLHFGTLTQNLLQPMPDNHWFVVSWSLTVEEWFYLLFGGAAIFAAALSRRMWAIWIPLIALLAAPAALRLTVPAAADYASGLMKMVPFRMDEIGVGVVLAWLEWHRGDEGKQSFFEKKAAPALRDQKTFLSCDVSPPRAIPSAPKRLTQPKRKRFLVPQGGRRLFFKKGLLAFVTSPLDGRLRYWHPSLAAGVFLMAAAWFDWLPLPFRVFVLFRNEIAALGCALCIPACLRLHRAPIWLAAPARALSRRAYPLYLVHLTVLVDLAQVNWMAHRISAWAAVAIFVAGTAACAEILSRCIEQPFMRLRPPQIPHAAPTRIGLIIEAEILRTAM